MVQRKDKTCSDTYSDVQEAKCTEYKETKKIK